MPEIGECYTIADKIPELGKISKIETTKNFYSHINLSKDINLNKIQGANVSKPFAFGKSIWFYFQKNDSHGFLISQLGMTGAWMLGANAQRDSRHNHLILYFKQETLYYSDPRMFGKMKIFIYPKDLSLEQIKEKTLSTYSWGKDPTRLSHKELIKTIKEGWANRKKPIKKLMMDQNKIFGIGNYLASEILFDAKISPLRLGVELGEENIHQLALSITKIIKLAIKTGGHSFAKGYLHPDGSLGKMSSKIKVYGKNQSPCPVCSHKIQELYIDNRVTFFCSFCQK